MKDKESLCSSWHKIHPKVSLCVCGDTPQCPALPAPSAELVWVLCTLSPKKLDLGSFSLHSLQEYADDAVATLFDSLMLSIPQGQSFLMVMPKTVVILQRDLLACIFWIWGIRWLTAFPDSCLPLGGLELKWGSPIGDGGDYLWFLVRFRLRFISILVYLLSSFDIVSVYAILLQLTL